MCFLRLTSACLCFTCFAGSNHFAVVGLRACLNDDGLRGTGLFFPHTGKRGIYGLLVFRAGLHRRLFMTLLAGKLVTLESRLAGFKACFSFGSPFFFLCDGVNLRLFLAEILHQGNITRAYPGAGTTLNTVGKIMRCRFIVLLAFAEPVQLLG
ncbi:hypothetical protein ACUY4R_001888 [Kosakonia sp. BK9b]